MPIRTVSAKTNPDQVTNPGRGNALIRHRIGLLAVIILSSLTLAACGEDPTPVPPTPTPPPRFQQENNLELSFTMNVPFGWAKNVVDSSTVVFINPKDENQGVGVVSRQITRLTPNSTRLLEERVDQLKKRFPGLRQDKAGGGTVTLVDTTISVDRLSYTNSNGVDVIQYVAQANNVRADRAYVLYAVSTAKDSNLNTPLFIESFRSFASTAAEVARSGESGVADPTILAANEGGIIRPANAPVSQGRTLKLVNWESPPLNPASKQPRLTGQFPLEYRWRLRPFPQAPGGPLVPVSGNLPTPTPAKNSAILEKPAIYIESPIVDASTRQSTMIFAVYRDALPAASPSPDEWRRFYAPIQEVLVLTTLKSYGENLTTSEISQVGSFYRMLYTARDDRGEVQSRGEIIFSKSGPHGLVSVMSLSQVASIKQSLVESYQSDFEKIVSSLQVSFGS